MLMGQLPPLVRCVTSPASAPQARVDAIAIAFISTRLLYIWCYVMDLANLRSLVWMIGLGLSISLFVISA